jgi:hypothetical protein
MKKDNLYYLKWDLENKSFLLDTQSTLNGFDYCIKKQLITQEQAVKFGEKIEYKYLNRNRYIDMNVLEFEFERFFIICKKCKTATAKPDWARRQGDLCYDCYRAGLSDKYKALWKKYWERRRLERLQIYAKTDQGIADSVGASAIRANIKIQLIKAGKTQNDLAAMLGTRPGNVSKMFLNNKTLKIEIIYKVAEWLFIPIDLLLKRPRGANKVKRKNKIPINIYRGNIRRI